MAQRYEARLSSSSSHSISRRPPAAAFAQPPPGQTSHTAALYSSGSEPIRSFGFASGFGDKYDLAEQLGSGTFGIVHVAVHKETGERFAVKSMPKRFAGDGTLEAYYVRRVLNEVDICNHLGSDSVLNEVDICNHLGRSLNVCYLYEVFEDGTCVDLVMELCAGGQLWDKVKMGSYSEKDAQRLVREMARAVAQCHGMDVMLRDIKPENFMFLDKTPDSPLKAIDFGISVFCKPGQYVDVRAGTPIYIAPEVLRMNYTLSADVWSLGIVAYQLLTGRLPFSGEDGQEVSDEYMAKQQYNNKDVFRAVLKAELDFTSPPWDTLSAAARDFVQSCLNRDEKKRPTAEQLLQHPWLQDEADISDVPFADTIVQRLQRYGLYGRFRQVALKALMQSIAEQDGESSQQFRDMRRVFEQMDRNADGRVTYSELKAALQSGHFQLSPSEVEQLAEQLDSQHSGTIDWSEWVAAMADWRSFQGTRDWDVLIGRAFAAMDPNGDGVISAEELEQLLCGEDGCEFPDTVEAALREADRDHDGVVSMQDFKEFIESKTDDSLSLFEARVSRDGSGSDSSGSSGSSDSA
ncbi:calcium-dependent kinase 26-like [Chlorella sorokiniana]|uniref:Calcium-dependent kinase 26-like n=1 Tax=Chlorella sorokiniana TaxID=3076 RepID=A0A2P6TE52_CHLSO|nr:calcium-dependent kinase 26-like [Chlorella sorokiniana]|eukprot:PRW20925.1 calcium-dependent kinase 26-like [Chlorella sorokiniana]